MAARSGQVTVVAAGSAVRPPFSTAKVVAVKGHPDNADSVWVGNDGAGDVNNTNGFPLDPGEGLVLTGGLSDCLVDADSSGDKLCYIVLEW